jgi:arginase
LSFEELSSLLRHLLAGDAVGMQVTVFDPDLDPDGSQARALTDCLISALA